MQSSSYPKKLSIPFAASGEKQDIPNTSQIGIEDGRASYPDGFPPLTRTPIAAGGVPPYGTDFNGILFDLSSSARWFAAGSYFKYDSAFSSSIGGYPKGAILINSTSDGFWQNTSENNTTNPDTGGAGWIGASNGRLLNTRVYSSSATYTPSTGTKIIVVEMVGGGGSGASGERNGTGFYSGGGGGASGCYLKFQLSANGVSAVPITVGSGGVSIVGTSSNGFQGASTSFGSYATALGGNGGLVLASSTSIPAIYGSAPPRASFGNTGPGVSVISYDCGNVSGDAIVMNNGSRGGFGAASRLGGSSFGPGINTTGISANTPGGGGSGVVCNTFTYLSSGAGAAGLVIIYEYS